jgi:hypothetical protein
MQREISAAMRQLIMGFRTTQLIYVAAKLGLADRLADRPKSAPALAAELRASPDALRRFLRALDAAGIVAETADGEFGLTAMGDLLRSNAPGSMRNVALLYGDEWLWRPYGNMLHSVLTGQPAFFATHGQGFYEYLDRHPEAGAVFQAAMDDFSRNEAAAILSAYSFKDARTVVDIGAGRGALLAVILQANPELQGVAFDLPSAERECIRGLEEAGLAHRTAFIAGDFFQAVPEGHDLYLLKSVLHNWTDAAATRILAVCRGAISRTGRLLVMERVIADGPQSAEAKLFDVNMLVTAGGQERTAEEYRTLLAGGGFAVLRILPASSLTIIEAAPQSE